MSSAKSRKNRINPDPASYLSHSTDGYTLFSVTPTLAPLCLSQFHNSVTLSIFDTRNAPYTDSHLTLVHRRVGAAPYAREARSEGLRGVAGGVMFPSMGECPRCRRDAGGVGGIEKSCEGGDGTKEMQRKVVPPWSLSIFSLYQSQPSLVGDTIEYLAAQVWCREGVLGYLREAYWDEGWR